MEDCKSGNLNSPRTKRQLVFCSEMKCEIEKNEGLRHKKFKVEKCLQFTLN